LGVASRARMIVLKTKSLVDSQWAFKPARDGVIKKGRQGIPVALFGDH